MRPLLHSALLPVLLAVALHLRTLRFGYTFDDRAAVRDNADVTDLSRPWSALLASDFWGQPSANAMSNKSYRPLTIGVYRAVRALFGGDFPASHLSPAPFHALNVLLHAGAPRGAGCAALRYVVSAGPSRSSVSRAARSRHRAGARPGAPPGGAGGAPGRVVVRICHWSAISLPISSLLCFPSFLLTHRST